MVTVGTLLVLVQSVCNVCKEPANIDFNSSSNAVITMFCKNLRKPRKNFTEIKYGNKSARAKTIRRFISIDRRLICN